MRTAWLLGLLGLAACGGPLSVQEQVKGYSGHSRNYTVGQVDSTLSGVENHDAARTPNGNFPLYWGSYDGSRMCVVSNVDYQIFQTPASELAQNYAASVKRARVSFALYDKYDDIPADGPPPQPSENRVTLDKAYTVPMEDMHGETVQRPRWKGASEYCVTAPPIAASNRLVVVKSFAPEQTNVYIWEIQGAPEVTNVGTRASRAPAETTTPQVSPASPLSSATTGSTSDILETLKQQKGYLAFLTVVECAGKNDELANGKFDVLAFSDPTVLRVMPDKKERHGLKKKPDVCLAIYNAHVAKRVSREGSSIKATSLDGKTRDVKLDTSLPVIATTNGTIYPVQEMWK
jgi:hypothetical protein